MVDYVYICRSGENEELRYSIRSVITNASQPNIFLFGQAPNWYRGNVELIKERGSKYTRARNNLTAITKSEAVSEKFVLMNDDFFIMKKISTPEIWHGGYLIDKIEERKAKDPDAPYVSQLMETYKSLKRLGIKDPIDYELHTPLVMTKTGLAEALRHAGLWRSLYGNLNNIGGKLHKDVKVYPKDFRFDSYNWKKKSLYLSTMEEAFNDDVGAMIRSKFVTPTVYEG